MGYWDVLDLLELGDKWWSARDVMDSLKTSYNTVNKHLRKLVGLGYVISEETIKNIGNYKIPYNVYKAVKHFGKVGKNE